MGTSSSAQARVYRGDRSSDAIAFPLELSGRARYQLRAVDVLQYVDRKLREAARPAALTTDRVREYCAHIGKASHHFERVLLREALGVVNVDDLVKRLLLAVRDAEDGALVLASAFHCTAERSGDRLVLRMRSAEAIGPRAVIDLDQPDDATLSAATPVGGQLTLEGTMASRGRATRLTARWDVARGVRYASFGGSATSGLPSPIDALVGFVGGAVLSRFVDQLPARLGALLDASEEPAFLHVERLMRLGRLTHRSRVYLLYWQRLRDYLLWCLTAEVSPARAAMPPEAVSVSRPG